MIFYFHTSTLKRIHDLPHLKALIIRLFAPSFPNSLDSSLKSHHNTDAMEILKNAILGITQGLTEFLPISSSGHLFMIEQFFGMKMDLVFEIWLHMASLLAVLIFFRKEIKEILVGIWSFVKKSRIQTNEKNKNGILGFKLLVSTCCTVPVALFFEKRFDTFLSFRSVAIMLLLTSLLIVISEQFRPKKEKEFSWILAILLGLFQGIAAIPGLSRSGVTISFLILAGIERKKAAAISFLLSIPTILGAFVFTIAKHGITVDLGIAQIIGYIFAFISALFAISYMMKLIQKNWIYFAPYCALVGMTLLIFFDK